MSNSINENEEMISALNVEQLTKAVKLLMQIEKNIEDSNDDLESIKKMHKAYKKNISKLGFNEEALPELERYTVECSKLEDGTFDYALGYERLCIETAIFIDEPLIGECLNKGIEVGALFNEDDLFYFERFNIELFVEENA